MPQEKYCSAYQIGTDQMRNKLASFLLPACLNPYVKFLSVLSAFYRYKSQHTAAREKTHQPKGDDEAKKYNEDYISNVV
jgi:hypothetical protein